MDLKALRRIPEERISGVLGIPAIVAGLGAGLDRSTFANFKEAREAAYESMIIPSQRIIGSALKRQLLRDFEDDITQWKVGYDLSDVRILQEDENQMSTRTVAEVQGGILKVSDAQRILRLPVDDTQDYYLRQFTVVPVPSGPPPEPEPPISKSEKKSLDDNGKEAYWNGWVSKSENYERQFLIHLRSMFSGQEKEAIQNLKSGQSEHLINLANAKKAYTDNMTPILTGLTQEGIADAQALIGQPIKQLKQADFSALRWLKGRIPWAGSAISEETAKLLAEGLAAGYTAGESIPELSKRVRSLFDDMKKYRATRIARTEIIATSNQAALSTYQDYGVTRKEWLSAYDERTRDTHVAANGQVVAVTDNFSVGGGSGPAPGQIGLAAEDINCRCTILPVVD